mmetsp:Transcript_5310/g.12781  ORF Transcript_5310/g.12781 Transcript_5310/m.12781 type:complete len:217 (+) Transcript_5310:62-712(+)
MAGDAFNGTDDVVAALSKQLGVDSNAVKRIFEAGVNFNENLHKRRRVTEAEVAPAADSRTSAPADAKSSGNGTGEATNFKFSGHVTLEQLRAELADFAVQRDWDQFHSPRNLALAMVGEVGELCECFQWKGEVQEGLPGWSEKDRTHLEQELSDVLLYLCRLSHKCHVDLPQAALNKLLVNAAKYPADLVRGSSKKYSEYKTAARSGPSESASGAA